MSNASPATPQPPRWWRNEDWLAVIIGGIVIGLVLLGWRPTMPAFKWDTATGLGKVLGIANLLPTEILGLALLVLAAPAIVALGGNLPKFIGGYAVVFTLACVAQLGAGHATMNAWGIEYVIFALTLGLVINHTVGVPGWLREAVRTEFYIKTGLVVLGSTILFQEILKAGALGIAQALLVVTVVWYVAFWLARKLRVDDEFAVMLASAVSICGVSAAIATCGAIQGDRKKLSYVTSIVLIVAVPMMVLMPWAAKAWHLPEVVAGAWLGGTLDTSGSVVAAGQLIGEQAMKTGVVVKFSQNVLIGVAAFVLSIWWSMRARAGKSAQEIKAPTARVIWERFPKFVLGFVGASLLFSFVLSPALVTDAKPILNGIRNFWFAVAFVSIGLETHFGNLVTMEGGRPAITFIIAQAFNVVWTLVLAWLLFGGILFAVPVMK